MFSQVSERFASCLRLPWPSFVSNRDRFILFFDRLDPHFLQTKKHDPETHHFPSNVFENKHQLPLSKLIDNTSAHSFQYFHMQSDAPCSWQIYIAVGNAVGDWQCYPIVILFEVPINMFDSYRVWCRRCCCKLGKWKQRGKCLQQISIYICSQCFELYMIVLHGFLGICLIIETARGQGESAKWPTDAPETMQELKKWRDWAPGYFEYEAPSVQHHLENRVCATPHATPKPYLHKLWPSRAGMKSWFKTYWKQTLRKINLLI